MRAARRHYSFMDQGKTRAMPALTRNMASSEELWPLSALGTGSTVVPFSWFAPSVSALRSGLRRKTGQELGCDGEVDESEGAESSLTTTYPVCVFDWTPQSRCVPLVGAGALCSLTSTPAAKMVVLPGSIR